MGSIHYLCDYFAAVIYISFVGGHLLDLPITPFAGLFTVISYSPAQQAIRLVPGYQAAYMYTDANASGSKRRAQIYQGKLGVVSKTLTQS